MNTTMIWINIFLFLFVTSCGTAPLGEKKCEIVEHHSDVLYQIQIDKKPISDQWFLHEDAVEIVNDLIKKNRCKLL